MKTYKIDWNAYRVLLKKYNLDIKKKKRVLIQRIDEYATMISRNESDTKINIFLYGDYRKAVHDYTLAILKRDEFVERFRVNNGFTSLPLKAV